MTLGGHATIAVRDRRRRTAVARKCSGLLRGIPGKVVFLGIQDMLIFPLMVVDPEIEISGW